LGDVSSDVPSSFCPGIFPQVDTEADEESHPLDQANHLLTALLLVLGGMFTEPVDSPIDHANSCLESIRFREAVAELNESPGRDGLLRWLERGHKMDATLAEAEGYGHNLTQVCMKVFGPCSPDVCRRRMTNLAYSTGRLSHTVQNAVRAIGARPAAGRASLFGEAMSGVNGAGMRRLAGAIRMAHALGVWAFAGLLLERCESCKHSKHALRAAAGLPDLPPPPEGEGCGRCAACVRVAFQQDRRVLANWFAQQSTKRKRAHE